MTTFKDFSLIKTVLDKYFHLILSAGFSCQGIIYPGESVAALKLAEIYFIFFHSTFFPCVVIKVVVFPSSLINSKMV